MKKALSLFLAFMMIFGIAAVGISEAPRSHAETAQSTFLENDFYYTVSDGKATVVDYADTLSTDGIIIPETLGGYPVTAIGKEAFRGCRCTSIKISATVTEIDNEAFAYDMPNLEAYYVDEANSVFSGDEYGVLYSKISGYTAIFAYPKNSSAKIYETKIDIGKYVLPFAFTEVKNLEEVYTRGPSNSRVENYAFYGAVDLKKVFIDDCVFVGEKAFANCEKLADINLDYDIKRIEPDAFENTALIKDKSKYDEDGVLILYDKYIVATLPEYDRESYSVGENIKAIAAGAFMWESLEEVCFYYGAPYMQSNPFYRCPNLKTFRISGGGKLSVDDNGVLRYNKYIVAYPNGRYETCYVMPSDTTQVYAYAFYNSPVQNFYIPSTVTKLDICALGADTVKNIYFGSNETKWATANLLDGDCADLPNAVDSATVHFNSYSAESHAVITKTNEKASCICGCETELDVSDGVYFENGFAYRIVNGKAEIVSCPDYITGEMVVPETIGGFTVSSIAGQAFALCKCTSISIPSGVESIAKSSGLWNEQPSGKTSIVSHITVSEDNNYYASEDGVLYNKDKTVLLLYPDCKSGNEFTVPEGVETIASDSFRDCPMLETLTIGGTVKTIEANACRNLFNLTTLNIESGVEYIGDHAFADSDLKNINLASGIKYIGRDVFEGCYLALFNDNYTNGVIELGEYITLVKDDSGKTEYTVPDGTTVIAAGAFKWSKTQKITIPASVVTIGEGAFTACPSLVEISVSEDNPYFCTDENGVLYNKDKTKLIAYPAGNKQACFFVPDSVTEIVPYAMDYNSILSNKYIPSSVSKIGKNALGTNSDMIIRYQSDAASFEQIDFAGETKYREFIINLVEENFDAPLDVEHKSVITVTDPTCTEKGVEAIACECGYVHKNYTPANGHKESSVDIIIKPATCTERSIYYRDCLVCGERAVTIYGLALGHKYDKITTPATCEQSGSTLYDCTRCDYSYTKSIAPKGHTFGKWEYDSGDKFSGICSLCNTAFKSINVSIMLDKTSIGIFTGDEEIITAEVTENLSDTLVFVSSDESVATVDANGTVKAVAPGTATITAMLSGTEISTACTVTVSAKSYPVDWMVGEDVYTVTTVAENGVIMPPEPPVMEGHEFVGWSPEIPDKMPSQGLAFTAVFNKVSKAENFDVSAIYAPDAFNEPVSLDVKEVEGDREPGGIYMVDGEYYVQVGLYNIKTVNENSEVVQPNEGYKVTIRLALPEAYADRKDFVVYHRFVDGRREQLSTKNGTLKVENGYLIFDVTQFSEFELFVEADKVTPSIKITSLPDKTVYACGEEIDLTGIRVVYTNSDGEKKVVSNIRHLSVSGYNSKEVGTQTVTVKYANCSDTFEVTVRYTFWQWIIKILTFGFFKF